MRGRVKGGGGAAGRGSMGGLGINGPLLVSLTALLSLS